MLGMDLEIWRGFSEYHTPEPEKAKYMLAGGMYVTEDGWFSPEDRMKYYIFELDQEGGRSLAAIMIMGAGGGAPDGETQEMRDSFDAMVERALADARVAEAGNLAPDLNRNGIPEELRVASIDGGAGEKLEVWENGRLLYEEEGYHAHVGYNALFLYRHESGDYLLRYNPYMGQGWCTYSYQLFTLEHGKENLIREDSVEFDISFHPMMKENHQFDVNEIVRFMNGVNELLSHSVQLLNTDSDLLDTFEKNGRLYDDLGWLDTWEPVYARGGQALPDELWRFKTAMEEQWDDPWGLTLTAGSPSPTGVTLNFIQAGGAPTGRLQYGSKYWLEREDEGDWDPVALLRGAYWTGEAHRIPMDGRATEVVDWTRFYGELPPGRYRICKEVMDLRDTGDYDTRTYYAEFFVD